MTGKEIILDTNAVLRFITGDNIEIKENLVFEENVIRYGCNTFASTNLDFIDCILIAYANVKGNPVFTFDNDLNKQLKHNAFNHG